jgi:hypothetical protein
LLVVSQVNNLSTRQLLINTYAKIAEIHKSLPNKISLASFLLQKFEKELMGTNFIEEFEFLNSNTYKTQKLII